MRCLSCGRFSAVKGILPKVMMKRITPNDQQSTCCCWGLLFGVLCWVLLMVVVVILGLELMLLEWCRKCCWCLFGVVELEVLLSCCCQGVELNQ